MQSLKYFTKDEIDNLICYGKRNSGFEEIVFSTSEWNACQDYYQGFDVYPKEYQGQHEINWTIEDIEEYIIL